MRASIHTKDQRAAQAYSFSWKLLVADFSVGFSNKQIVLLPLVKGDIVLRGAVHVRTGVLGPTGAPTAQIKAGSVAITPLAAVKTVDVLAVTDNTILGAAGMSAAGNLVLDLQLGAGDGAAATAGEIVVSVEINRVQNRNLDAF